MKYKYFLILILLLPFINNNGQIKTDEILNRLDSTLANRTIYERVKEQQLQETKRLLSFSQHDKIQKFRVLGDLANQYLQYNTDSCKKYLDMRMAIAQKIGNPVYIAEVNLNLAEWYTTIGLYSQAHEILIKEHSCLTDSLRLYYYRINITYYNFLVSYSATKDFKQAFQDSSCIYYDSIVATYPHDNVQYWLSSADLKRVQNHPAEAIKLLQPLFNKTDINHDNIRLLAANLAQDYLKLGDRDTAKYYFAISAISDIKHCVKENMSLRMLSVLLFEDGDIERANKYLQYCMDDAIECKARFREVEVGTQMPAIVKAYQETINKKNKVLKLTNLGLFLLIVVLLITFFYSIIQNHRLKNAKKNIIQTNRSLEQANNKLNSAIENLRLANNMLSESNCIKDEYIVQYINLCSSYIDQMEEYRHSLLKMSTDKKIDRLLNTLRSNMFVEKQLKEFYLNFDLSFLKIFPTFIADFNAMLKPQERLKLKSDGQMPTEMRIFALIRLGITDSNYLAQFLRCSVQTIYNYRSKIRTKLINKNINFEEQLKNIGSLKNTIK